MNKCIFSGRLTRDPETKQSQGGMTITRFSLAVDRMKTKNNQDPGTDFLNFVAFDSRGDFVSKYFHKGSKAFIEAHVQTGSYEGQNGKVYTTDFIIDNIEFGDSKNNGQSAQVATNDSKSEFVNVPDDVPESLPFN